MGDFIIYSAFSFAERVKVKKLEERHMLPYYVMEICVAPHPIENSKFPSNRFYSFDFSNPIIQAIHVKPKFNYIASFISLRNNGRPGQYSSDKLQKLLPQRCMHLTHTHTHTQDSCFFAMCSQHGIIDSQNN